MSFRYALRRRITGLSGLDLAIADQRSMQLVREEEIRDNLRSSIQLARSASPPERRNTTPTPPASRSSIHSPPASRNRSHSPQARRNPSPERIVIRSESPMRESSPEALMVDQDTVIQLPWDAEYAEAFNRTIRESQIHNIWTLRSPETNRFQTLKRNRRERSENSSEAGIGCYRCVVGGCGKSVQNQGDMCDRCDDRQDALAEQDADEEREDITETEWLSIGMDTLEITEEGEDEDTLGI